MFEYKAACTVRSRSIEAQCTSHLLYIPVASLIDVAVLLDAGF